MTTFLQWPRVAGVVCALALGSCRSGSGPAVSVSEHDYFEREVRPILELNCLPCHDGRVLPGRLDLTTRERALAGRLRGRAFLSPGRPDDSLILTAISRQGTHPKLMPQRDLSLTEEDIGTLREWIADGAYWPAGPSGTLRARKNPEIPTPVE